MAQFKDLSDFHHLISDLFPTMDAREAMEAYGLNEEQLAFYEAHGYLSHVQILDDHQIEYLRKDLTELMQSEQSNNELFYEFHLNESEDENSVLFHSLGHWRVSLGFHDILWNPRFVVAAYQLLGERSVRFWHDQLFCKPAYHGGVVAWHQDYSYWTRTIPMQHLTCWVGLDDARVDNGCLHYIPGSHKWDLLDRTNLAGSMDGLMDFLSEDQKAAFESAVAIEMPKGYGTFHHPLLVHGSYENRSHRPRRAFVLNVFADNTYAASDEPLLNGVPQVPRGQKLEGRFFPLLYSTTTID